MRVIALLFLCLVAVLLFQRAYHAMGSGGEGGQPDYASSGPVAAFQSNANAVASQIDPKQSKLFDRPAAKPSQPGK